MEGPPIFADWIFQREEGVLVPFTFAEYHLAPFLEWAATGVEDGEVLAFGTAAIDEGYPFFGYRVARGEVVPLRGALVDPEGRVVAVYPHPVDEA